jgi:hypothetical protein
MRSCVIVLLSPGITDASGLLDRGKPPAVQAAIAEDAVKALVVPVRPRPPRLNAVGRALLGHERWAIVTLPIVRGTTLGQQPLQHADDLTRCDRPGTIHAQALPGICIHHGQALQPPSIAGLVVYNIIAPDMIGVRSPRRGGVLVPIGRRLRPCFRTWSPSPFHRRRTVSRLPWHCSAFNKAKILR